VLAEVFRTPPGEQAKTLRSLERHHLSALVLVADRDDPEVPAAVGELSARGMPVILLDQALALEGTKLPTVVESSVEADASKLVGAVLRSAEKLGFPKTGPAVVLVNGPFDEKGENRVAAIKAALLEANVETLPDAVFQGFMKEASEALKATLEHHPDVAIVIADEDQGARAAATVRDNLAREAKGFVLAGFGQSPELRHMANFNLFAALVERDLEKQATQALAAAVTRARGGDVPEQIAVPARFSSTLEPAMRSAMPDVASRKPVDPYKALNQGLGEGGDPKKSAGNP
jgi:ABC-type sugar transport system substrate-binding protein